MGVLGIYVLHCGFVGSSKEDQPEALAYASELLENLYAREAPISALGVVEEAIEGVAELGAELGGCESACGWHMFVACSRFDHRMAWRESYLVNWARRLKASRSISFEVMYPQS